MSTDLRNNLAGLEAELDDLYTMSEEAARFRYNVDNKAEAIAILQAEIDSILAEDEDEDGDDYYRGWCDPAFRTEADFYRMRI